MTQSNTQGDEWTSARDWAKAGDRVALAQVVTTWGSSPRPLGSLLAIRGDGVFEGSVSGGCVEGAVVTEALDILKSGKPKLMEFGVSNADAWQVGLSCGGQISILVAPLKPSQAPLLEALIKAREARTATVLATRFSDGAMALFRDGKWLSANAPDVWQGVTATAQSALTAGAPLVAGEKEGKLFFNVIAPAPRMFIVGAVHIAQSLIPGAVMAGFDVTLIDPRGAFAEDSRFPGVAIVRDWPDEVLEKENLGPECAVVTLTHDPKLDDAALGAALKSSCFYIGSLGSKKTHAARLKRLSEGGFSEDELARINGPVGLDIGAKTPAEIAVSILAEVIKTKRGPAP